MGGFVSALGCKSVLDLHIYGIDRVEWLTIRDNGTREGFIDIILMLTLQ